MLELNLKEIVDVLGGQIYGATDISSFNAVSTDTRNIGNGDIFIALKGANFNGNKYFEEAYSKGASLCIVDEFLVKNIKKIPDGCSLLVVDDAELSLGRLASYYLDKMNVKVIGVTGSVGKTSTKDMIAAALSKKYKLLKTLGNFNNHIGLPLTIFRLDSSYEVAILEMGMSQSKEIEYLAKIAKPHIGVITNIGLSHIENLGSQDNILKAKMEIATYFNSDNTLIVNGEDTYLNSINSDSYEIIKTGFKKEFNYSANNISLNSLSSTFNVALPYTNDKCSLDLPGKHNIINYLLAIAVSDKLNVPFDLVKEGIKTIEKTSMRLDIVDNNGYTIINDCYNASPDSMKSAIDVQINLNKNRNIAVLGPMNELGDLSKQAHVELAEYVLNNNIDMVFTTGTYTDEYKKVLDDKCRFFANKDELIASLKSYARKGDSILIKASRGAKYEDIYNGLLVNQA